MDEILQAAKVADWQQVVLNGGPPCFHVEKGRFCLRAERWEGHEDPGICHSYVDLYDLLVSVHASADPAPVETPKPGEYYVCSQGYEHKGWMDGCMLWWREGGHGYTYDLNDAGIFTEADMGKRYPDPATCMYIPREIVDDNAYSPKLAWWSSPRMGNRPICEVVREVPQ